MGWLLVNLMHSHGQIQISGTVVNEKDNSPLPYVAIGMPNTSAGTISELDGSFQLEVPAKWIGRELLFSALGFERVSIVLNTQPDSSIVVRLREKTVVLDEVTVEGRNKFKRFEFGNAEYDGGSMYAHTDAAGSAMVMLIDNAFPHHSNFTFPAHLDKVALRIVNNTFREFKLRLRLYSVDSITGLPGQELLQNDIIAHKKLRNGWVEIALSDYNLLLDAPFFIGFEWILDARDRKFLHQQYSEWNKKHPNTVTQESVTRGSNAVEYANYNGTMWAGTSFGTSATLKNSSKYKCYYRYNSFGEWLASPAALCIRVIMAM